MPKNRDSLVIHVGDWAEVCEPHSSPWYGEERVELLSRVGQVVTVGDTKSDIEFPYEGTTLLAVVPNDKLSWADPIEAAHPVTGSRARDYDSTQHSIFAKKYLSAWQDLQTTLATERPDVLSGEIIRLNTRLDIKRVWVTGDLHLVCRLRVWAIDGGLMEEEIATVIEAVAALRDEADDIMHGLQIEIANNALEISNVVDPSVRDC